MGNHTQYGTSGFWKAKSNTMRSKSLATRIKSTISFGILVSALMSGTAFAKQTAAVAMGDSFISGEGAEDYMDVDGHGFPGWTGNNDNPFFCHRSANASIFKAALPGIDERFNIACSGGKPEDVLNVSRRQVAPQVDELAQIAQDYDVKLILIGLSSNNRHFTFGQAAQKCIEGFVTDGLTHGFEDFLKDFGDNPINDETCKLDNFDNQTIIDEVQNDTVIAVSAVVDKMTELGYAPGSYKIVLQDYTNPLDPEFDPEFHSEDGRSDTRDRFKALVEERYAAGCPAHMEANDRGQVFSQKLGQLVERIGIEVVGLFPDQDIKYLNVQDAFNGGQLCGEILSPQNTLVTPVRVTRADGTVMDSIVNVSRSAIGDEFENCSKDKDFQRCQESWHPNKAGHEALGTCLSDAYMNDTTRVMTCHRDPSTTEVYGVARSPFINVEVNGNASYTVYNGDTAPRLTVHYDASVMYPGAPVESWKIVPYNYPTMVSLTQSNSEGPVGSVFATFMPGTEMTTLSFRVEAVIEGTTYISSGTYQYNFGGNSGGSGGPGDPGDDDGDGPGFPVLDEPDQP